ncbi:NAD(+) synthase [uncultured Anaerococcus sp.]|uniref:NAD(+) synthase n=1 Tax=uncultured Anaerococcus sp. TaxID=293428 RepID=UPI0026195B6C|nr:NAD(+) synthase [uncultured Anaerococcus sp.]
MKRNIKILSTNFDISLGDVEKNVIEIKNIVKKAEDEGVNILSLPELCLTGASLYDAYEEDILIDQVEKAVCDMCEFTKDYDLLVGIGAPLRACGEVFNTYLLLKKGEVVSTFVKDKLKNYEKTVFSNLAPTSFRINSLDLPVNSYHPINFGGLRIGVSIGEDEKKDIPQSLSSKTLGSDLILNPNAFEKTVLSKQKTLEDVSYLSKNLVYVSTGTGAGESSTDCVYQGLCIIACDGELKTWATNESVYLTKSFEIDGNGPWAFTKFTEKVDKVDKFPYLPSKDMADAYVSDVMDIATEALLTRIKKIGVKDVFLGVSGGLDSTMALLFINEAYKKVGLSKEHIHAYTMPAFGTSKRTKSNANYLCEALGITLTEINISQSVKVHLKDIGHDGVSQDLAYENAQARERTQVLLDLANMHGGIVIGTGDLSECMQGFATFNGDHISNYSLNGTLTKTHLRFIVGRLAETTNNEKLAKVLRDILETPISPELKNESDENISQKTEDIIGPYELIDFFIYYHLKEKLSPRQILALAKNAFIDTYDYETIKKWLRSYYKRFALSQFKRATAVDGPNITGLSTSPRMGYKIPSDLASNLYLGDFDD